MPQSAIPDTKADLLSLRLAAQMETDGDWKLAALKLPVHGAPDSLRISLISPGARSPGVQSPTFAGSGLDKLAMTAQQAKLKQLKRVQLMKAQTQANAHQQAAQQAREQQDEARSLDAAQRAAQLRAERLAREADVEARRQEIAAEAERRTEALKEHLTAKVGSHEQKAGLIARQRAAEAEEARLRKQAEFASRKEVLLRNSAAITEEREARLAQKRAAAEMAQQRLTELKARAEAEARARALQAEAERLQALESAELESQARHQYYQSKVEAKEEFLERMREEQAAVRAARIEEAKLREEYARRRLQIKNKRDELLQEELARKIDSKYEKMHAIQEQRRALMTELERTRKEIAAHDLILKEQAEAMKSSGHYAVSEDIEELERKYAEEVAALQLEALRLQTPGRSPALSRRASIASFRGARALPPATRALEHALADCAEHA